MTSHSDPGDQERGTRGKPRHPAPLPAPGQNDLFRDTQPPKGPSEGEKRKERALEKHEESGRAPLIRFLRNRLKALYYTRSHSDQAYVTADDAVKILRESKVVPTNDDGTEEDRKWMGALFKEPGWRYTGRTVPSLRNESNGRHVRCWRWEGA